MRGSAMDIGVTFVAKVMTTGPNIAARRYVKAVVDQNVLRVM